MNKVNNLYIGSINIAGLKTNNLHTSQKLNYLLMSKLDIIFLQETHLKANKITKIKQKLLPSPSFWSKHCAIIIKNKNISYQNFKTFLDNRVLTIDIKIYLFSYTLICIYAPNNPTNRIKFFQSCLNISSNYPPIWAGDFNCWTNPNTDRYPNTLSIPPGHFNLSFLKNHFLLTDTLSSNSMELKNMTRHHFSNSKHISSSRIDYIFLPPCLASFPRSHSTSNLSFSDHKLVSCSISLSFNFSKNT